MRKPLALAVAATLVLGGLATWRAAAAQNAPHSMHQAEHSETTTPAKATLAAPAKPAAAAPAATAAPAAAAPAAPVGLRALVSRQLTAAQKKLIALAEATPPEKFAWRPAEGVRSTGEVYMHVASANYFLPSVWGAKPAAGVDPRSLEKEGGDKAKTVAALKQSFDYVQQAMDAVPDAELTKAVQFFGRPSTTGEIMLGVATHAHEHLGQEIAYARMNGIVPPWSVAGGQGGQ